MTLQEWFARYSESHKNPTNKRIHFLCVPLIYYSIAGMLFPISVPGVPEANLTALLMLISLLFYLSLSSFLALLMGAFNAAIYFSLYHWAAWSPFPMVQSNLLIFVMAWIGQFIGHKIEGKKPSFFDDFKFLLIGPAWVAMELVPGRSRK